MFYFFSLDGHRRRRNPQPRGRPRGRRRVHGELHVRTLDLDRRPLPRTASRGRRLRHAPQGRNVRQAGHLLQPPQVN